MYHSGVDGRIRASEWDSVPQAPAWVGDFGNMHNETRRRRLRILGLHETDRSLRSSCPRELVGKSCGDSECWCRVSGNDHGATYLNEDGERVVFWEPYQIQGSELVEVITAARTDGIDVCVHGSSTYYPGRTLVVEFQAAKEDLRQALERPVRSR